jgi:hypothetical protein
MISPVVAQSRETNFAATPANRLKMRSLQLVELVVTARLLVTNPAQSARKAPTGIGVPVLLPIGKCRRCGRPN